LRKNAEKNLPKRDIIPNILLKKIPCVFESKIEEMIEKVVAKK